MNSTTGKADPIAEPITEYACARDYQLFGPGPKRVLALDGGGVRGAITVAFLERIEEIFCEQIGKEIRLGDYFHLIGGTSTGAIIAGALALGFRTGQVREFYTRLAPLAFRPRAWTIPILNPKFDVRGLRVEIEKIVGDLEIQSDKLITGVCVIAKRIDTGSPWIIANNPGAPYWEDGASYEGNKAYKLATLVRASTAAPHFFDPELIPINRRKDALPLETAAPLDKPLPIRFLKAVLERLHLRKKEVVDLTDYGLFIDGGVTPHNNPSLALLQMISINTFKLCWTPGPENLQITSIGTGTFRPRLNYQDLGFTRFVQLAYHALMSLMTDAEMMVLAQMQWLGECPAPWVINSEIGTLAGNAPPGGKLFKFLRYDVRLERQWLLKELKIDVPDSEVARYRCMDDPGIVKTIYEIASLAAKMQVKAEHFFPDAKSIPTEKTANCNAANPGG